MANEPTPYDAKKGVRADVDSAGASGKGDTYAELEEAGKRGSLFGRFNAALQQSRGASRRAELPAADVGADTNVDDIAIRRARNTRPQKMIVPDGVIINGSMSSGSETEISGRVDGDVTIEGDLYLGATALVTGNVRADNCKLEGLVEGKMECSQALDLSPTGRLKGDVLAGKRINVAGQVFGNVASSGALRLEKTAKVTGDIRAHSLLIEEGAMFNGACSMRLSAQGSKESGKT